MICKHCGAELDNMDGVLVDVVSGDAGGTYGYCPDNPVGTEDERLHEPPGWFTPAKREAFYRTFPFAEGDDDTR